MLSLLMAVTAASALQAPAAAPARSLESVPGVTIKYYDVTGKNDKAVRQSIASQRPKAPNGDPVPAGTNWDMSASITKRTEGNTCTITAAKVSFQGVAELPRHAEPATLKADFVQHWNAYVAELKTAAATDLGFVADNIGQVEKALVGIPCDQAGTALDAATARLKEQQRAASVARAQAAAAAAAAQAAAAKAKPAESEKPGTNSDGTRY